MDKEIYDYLETKDVTHLHTWVSENYKLFYAIVNNMLKKHTMYGYDADDLFSEAVIVFYNSIDKYDATKAKLSTFLYTSITNGLLNKIKKNRTHDFASRVPTVNIDDIMISPVDGREMLVESVVEDERLSDLMNPLLINSLNDYVDKYGSDLLKRIYEQYCEGIPITEIADSEFVSKQYISKVLVDLVEEVRKEWEIYE